jgi:uncharacterized lipoprotein YajG
MGRIAQIVAILMLAGCSTAPKLPERVLVPVAVSCVKDAPAVPTLRSEAEILAMDEYQSTIVVWVERLILRAYSEKADALLQACR